MQESKRQKQVAQVINEELNEIFRRLSLNMINGGMVSISKVTVTPDLLEARIYISFFQIDNKEAAMQKLAGKLWEIKKELGLKIKSQVRRMPELKLYEDDTLDYVFKMEELFKTIEKPDNNSTEA
jgi:ribosome-binding factor A